MNFLTIVNIFVIGLCGAIANPVEVSPQESSIDSLIVGGHETTIQEHPWQVSIQYEFTHQCGGTIIGAQWILTAGHCLDLLQDDDLVLRVGSNQHKKGGDYYIVLRNAVKHPLYKNFNYNYYDFDFALLELQDPLDFSDKVKPITLPNEEFNVPDGAMCVVSGWGRTQNPSESTDVLRAVNVPIVNQEYCKTQYEGMVEIKRQMICAGYKTGGKDACNRDFGGALEFKTNNGTYLIGVMSFNENCAEQNRPSVYGRVTHVREWIKHVTGL